MAIGTAAQAATDGVSLMPDIFDVADGFRRELLTGERAAASELARRYYAAYQRIRVELDALLQQIADAEATGTAITPGWILRQIRLQTLLDATKREIDTFARVAEQSITDQQRHAVDAAQGQAAALVRDQFGPHGVGVAFDRLPSDQLIDLVGFLSDGSPLRELLDALGPNASRLVRDALISGLALGQNPRVIARNIRDALGGNLVRALRIARTETLRAYRETALRSYRENGDVVKGWIWHSALGKRTCASCWAMHGSFHSLDEQLDDHVNGRCFPAGTLASGPAPVAASTRYYRGELVTIRTASGVELSFTPNHPILTPGGWVAGGLLVEGGYVVRSAGGQDTSATIYEHDYQVPARIEEIAESFGLVTAEMPTAAEDFHGDGKGSEVHVVRANRLLWDSLQPSLGEPGFEQNFGLGTMRDAFLASLGASDPFCQRHGAAANGILSDLDASEMFFGRRVRGEQAVRSSLIAPLDAERTQACLDGRTGNGEALGEAILGLAGPIESGNLAVGKAERSTAGSAHLGTGQSVASGPISEQSTSLECIRKALLAGVEAGCNVLRSLASNVCLDRIVEVRIGRFAGHVYNLQTPAGWYIANGIVTHNCSMVPVTKSYAELGIPGVRQEPLRVDKGADLFAKLTEADQLAILGPGKLAAYQEGRITLADLVHRTRSERWGTMRREASLHDALERSQGQDAA